MKGLIRVNGLGVVFTAPRMAELEEVTANESLSPTSIIVRTEASLISAGTESSYFSGVMESAPAIYAEVPPFEGAQASSSDGLYPARTGYANVGRVEQIGTAVDPSLLGRRVFTMSRHASVVEADTDFLVVPVPDGVTAADACFARLAGVGATALRAADTAAGDSVAIIGLGLVGNLTAQLFRIAGCDVVAFDPDPRRRALARHCGLQNVVDPFSDDPVEFVRARAGGGAASGANIVVEATGRAQQALQAIDMTGRYGATVLLGSPRVAAAAEVTDALARLHWLSLRVIGGSEWGYPIRVNPTHARFSIERNYLDIMDWIADRSLRVDPLVTHVMNPNECQTAYTGLLDDPYSHVGVVFDWASLAPSEGAAK